MAKDTRHKGDFHVVGDMIQFKLSDCLFPSPLPIPAPIGLDRIYAETGTSIPPRPN